MRQEEWTIRTNDGHKIYGITDFAAPSGHSNKCLVIVHGLTGHMNEYLLKSAANYFSAKGYDVYRFNLYHWDEGARHIDQCTLQTHAADLRKVLEDKVADYEKIFISGHSYGGPSIMVAQPDQATALSLWDPSFDLPNIIGKDIEARKVDGGYIMDGGVPWLSGEDMLEEMKTRYNVEEGLALSKALQSVPIQVISAAGHDAVYHEEKYSWNDAGHPDNERVYIRDADHCFFRNDTAEQLLNHAYDWFEKF